MELSPQVLTFLCGVERTWQIDSRLAYRIKTCVALRAKKMTELHELMRLCSEDIWAKIFSPGIAICRNHDVKNWQAWSEPDNPLAVDLVISRLRTPASNWAANLRSATELHRLGIGCPYYAARHSAYLASVQGSHWVKRVFRYRKKKQAADERVGELRTLLEAIRPWVCNPRHWEFHPPPSLYSDRASPDVTSRSYKTHRDLDAQLLAAQGAIARCAELIAEVFEGIPLHGNSTVNTWKAAFAAELGYCWRDLTGRDPTVSQSKNGPSFTQFVDAAFRSLGGTSNEKWDRAIRQMLHDRAPRPEWDGFDRNEHRRLSPSVYRQENGPANQPSIDACEGYASSIESNGPLQDP
jgi:hypothetical protein